MVSHPHFGGTFILRHFLILCFYVFLIKEMRGYLQKPIRFYLTHISHKFFSGEHQFVVDNPIWSFFE